MDRYLLRYFLAVAELGSFSKAAARGSVTQPTLSVGIAKLEHEVGARLFERTTRRVSLTPAGSRFLTHARRITQEYEAALRKVADEFSLMAIRALDLAKQSGASPRAHQLEDLAARAERGELDTRNGADAYRDQTAALSQELHYLQRSSSLLEALAKMEAAGVPPLSAEFVELEAILWTIDAEIAAIKQSPA